MTSRPVLRQLLAGRDFAVGDDLAKQMANYVYVVVDDERREALLVDPAYAPLELLGLLEAEGLALTGVLLTHYHADHAGGPLGSSRLAGIAELLERVQVPVHVHEDERPWIERTTGVAGSSLVGHSSGDIVQVGRHQITCLHTPGHTPGSQCLLVGGSVVTGDTLFLSGCGRTDLPGGDARALYDSLFHRLGALPASTVVLPGHDYSPRPSATLAEVRAANAVLADVDEDTWVRRLCG